MQQQIVSLPGSNVTSLPSLSTLHVSLIINTHSCYCFLFIYCYCFVLFEREWDEEECGLLPPVRVSRSATLAQFTAQSIHGVLLLGLFCNDRELYSCWKRLFCNLHQWCLRGKLSAADGERGVRIKMDEAGKESPDVPFSSTTILTSHKSSV